jgi:uncharacterized phage protein gp47/JayE
VTFTPRTYEQIARDLLTTLTGGTVRETLTAPPAGTPLVPDKLRNRPVRRISHLEGTISVGAGADARQIPYRFTAADFELVSASGNGAGDKEAIAFRKGGRAPVPGTPLTVNYYPVQSDPVPLTDLNVGSVTRTIVETFARELALGYLNLQHVYDSAFLDTAEGSSLDRVVALVGVTRLPAGFPVAKLTFTRGAGGPGRITVPAGTAVTDAAGNRYLTLAEITLEPNETSREVQAGGESPATPVVGAGALARTEVTVAGISKVTNAEPARALATAESDADLRRRARGALHGVVRGTSDALKFTLLSIQGVKDVTVVEEPNGVPGEIRIDVAYENESDESVKALVARTIAEVKPAGVRVLSQTAAHRRADVRAQLTLAGQGVAGAELDALKASLQERVSAFLKDVAPGGTVRRAQLAALALQDPRIVDAQILLTPQGGEEADSLTLGPGEVLDVGAVTFSPPPAAEAPAAAPPITSTVSATLPVHLAAGVTETEATNAIQLALESFLRTRGPGSPLTVDALAAAIRDDSRFALVRPNVQVTVQTDGRFLQLTDGVGSYAPEPNESLQRDGIAVSAVEGSA